MLHEADLRSIPSRVALSLRGQGGQEWAIVLGHDLRTASFGEVDTWFNRQKMTANPLAAGSWDTSQWGPEDACGGGGAMGDAASYGPCPTFPISSFLTTSDDLSQPLYDALLVRNEGAGDVVSYEVVTFMFTSQ